MEHSLQAQSFEESTLSDICSKLISQGNYPSDLLEFSVSPLFKEKLPYTVQYNQTPFEFLSSLAQRYGEWFYFDSTKLVFGSYGGKAIELIEEEDIQEYELKMRLKPQKFSFLGYESSSAQVLQSDTSQNTHREVELTNPFQQKAIETSNNRFPQTGESLFNNSLLVGGKEELKKAVERQKQAKENTLYLEARSTNPNLQLGDIVKLKGYMPENKTLKTGKVPLESYRIIEIEHSYSETEGYSNHFIAIPKEQQIPEYYNPKAYASAEEQRAVVTDNNDPEGIGRVRVQFDWQTKENTQSPWIRLIQPHAGSGKGFYFIPEIGEEVQIAFKSNNPEKPYVVGTHYNGAEKSGYHDENNQLKAIHTKDGHIVEFDERSESMGITIKDKNGNVIHLDTKDKNITVTTPETLTFNAKNLKINVEEDIETKVGRDIKTIAKNNISQDSGKKTILYSGDNTEISANRELDLYGKRQLIGYTEGKTEFGAKQQMHVYGGSSLITAQDKIEYKAPQMGKLAQAGKFKYGKEAEIIEVKWMDEKAEKEISELREKQKASIWVKTRNTEEGQEIVIKVEEADIEGNINPVEYKGKVNVENEAILTQNYSFNKEENE